MISSFFRFLLLLLPIYAIAQVDEVVVQPSLKISWDDGNRWSFNTLLEQRSTVKGEFDALHLQLAQYASYEIGFYSQIGVGLMYREVFDESRPEEFRSTLQFDNTRSYNTLKIAHRLRWDQRWRAERLTHRWRYQLSGSLPLSGTVTNPSEFYVTAALETLFIAENDQRPGYDQRFSIGLGRRLGKNYKLQFTTEYRMEDFTAVTDNRLFLNLALYYSL